MWKIWCKALGEKAFPSNNQADKVAIVRTVLVVITMVTNFVIIAVRIVTGKQIGRAHV